MGEPGSSSSSPGETERSSEQRIHPDSKFKSEPSTTFFGRHRMTAAITKLQNEINFIQEELEKLEVNGGSSIVCAELMPSVESIPDPLLPVTKGPADANWDLWFRGIHSSRGHKALDLLRKRERKFIEIFVRTS